MQKYANIVDLEKCCQTLIFLQNFVLIQPRTRPPKNCKNVLLLFFPKFANFVNPNPLTLTNPPRGAPAPAPSPANRSPGRSGGGSPRWTGRPALGARQGKRRTWRRKLLPDRTFHWSTLSNKFSKHFSKISDNFL